MKQKHKIKQKERGRGDLKKMKKEGEGSRRRQMFKRGIYTKCKIQIKKKSNLIFGFSGGSGWIGPK